MGLIQKFLVDKYLIEPDDIDEDAAIAYQDMKNAEKLIEEKKQKEFDKENKNKQYYERRS
jgi:hypothetical protein